MLTKKKAALAAMLVALCLLMCSCTVVVKSEPLEGVTVNPFFGNNMVLARNRNVAVFGTAADGTEVTVSFKTQKKTAVAENGEWLLYLDPMKADATGSNLSISANGKATVYTNVLVGEVWFCSGQSNMVNTVRDFGPQMLPDFLPDANNPLVRVARTQNLDWRISSTETIPQLPAYAAAYAARLQQLLGVPVGVIVRASGGTAIKLFLSGAVHDIYIKPALGLSVNGILWYHGESDTTHCDEYQESYEQVVDMLRNGFGDENLPFVSTQIANYALDGIQNRQWSDMRLTQLQCLDAVPNSYMVCQTEATRTASNIHPDNKKSLGVRAANLVAQEIFGMEGIYGTSPRFEKAEKTADGIEVTFSGVNVGLTCPDETVTEFRVCKADGDFYSAEAVITGTNTVLVKCDDTALITGVSYCDVSLPYTNMLDGENPVFNFQYFFEE